MMTEGLILAAGLSSRAGTYKLAWELEGKTIIERCIEGMYEACTRIIVVGGHQIQLLSPLVKPYSKVSLIHNQNYEEGMFSSVIKGLQYTKGDYVLITPGDYPFIEGSVCKKLLQSKGRIVVPTYQGRKGHPVLMNRNAVNQLLLSATNIPHLRAFIAEQGFTSLAVNCPGILLDIDTPADYLQAQDYLRQSFLSSIPQGG